MVDSPRNEPRVAHSQPRDQFNDVHVRAILLIGIGFVVLAVVTHGVLLLLFQWLAARENTTKESGYPLGQETTEQGREYPPEPRLRNIEPRSVGGDPRLPKGDLHTQQLMELHSYGWIDQEKQGVYIPIEQAIQRMLHQHQSPGSGSIPQPKTRSGLTFPSDANSGRAVIGPGRRRGNNR